MSHTGVSGQCCMGCMSCMGCAVANMAELSGVGHLGVQKIWIFLVQFGDFPAGHRALGHLDSA